MCVCVCVCVCVYIDILDYVNIYGVCVCVYVCACSALNFLLLHFPFPFTDVYMWCAISGVQKQLVISVDTCTLICAYLYSLNRLLYNTQVQDIVRVISKDSLPS